MDHNAKPRPLDGSLVIEQHESGIRVIVIQDGYYEGRFDIHAAMSRVSKHHADRIKEHERHVYDTESLKTGRLTKAARRK